MKVEHVKSGDMPKLEPQRPVDERLWKVAQQFEALLWQQMVSEMQKSVPKSELLPSGFAEDVHSSMFAQALSDVLAQGTANQPLVHAIYTQLGGGRNESPSQGVRDSGDKNTVIDERQTEGVNHAH